MGIHNDAVVNKARGMNLPVLNLHERVLSVLGCRHVDDVLIDAPYEITEDMLASLRIAEVIQVVDGDAEVDANRFRVAEEKGLLHRMTTNCGFNMGSIVQRVHRNQEAFQARFERKMAAEKTFFKEKRQSNGA